MRAALRAIKLIVRLIWVRWVVEPFVRPPFPPSHDDQQQTDAADFASS
jgi:hypothetical protein